MNYWLLARLHLPAEITRICFPDHLIKNGARICPVYLAKFVSEERVDRALLVALIAHHTPMVICNCTSCISLGLSADQYVALSVCLTV